MTLKSIFPHREQGEASFREGQEWLLYELYDCIMNDDIRFIVVEAPTGIGKTAVAGTISSHSGPSYYLTEQKIHQDQMLEEFPRRTALCKGQRNYDCGEECEGCVDPIPGMSCVQKPTTDGDGAWAGESWARGDLYWQTGAPRKCPYFQSKTDAMESDIGCLNYSYFFNETYYTGSIGGFGGDFGKRNVMVCDEAHNIERNMKSFLTFRIDEFVKEETGLDIVDLGPKISHWENWICQDLRSAIEPRVDELRDKAERMWMTDEEISYDLLDRKDRLNEIGCNVRRFQGEFDSDYFGDMDWSVERSYEDGDLDHVEFTPVSIAPFAERFLFNYADTIIMMSATILDLQTFLRSLGLVQYEDQVYQITFDESPFPRENRPIYYYDAPGVNNQNWQSTFPHTIRFVDAIAQDYPEEKGIIHSVSYRNSREIDERISNETRPRLMVHDRSDRDEMIDRFKESNEPRILVSPSIYEGLDLKYDQSRFQIIPKVPYLNLGSKAIKYRKKKDPQWYDWRTAIRLIQSWGRSVRARDDHADTHIVDGSFKSFYERNQRLFPKYLNDVIREKDFRILLNKI